MTPIEWLVIGSIAVAATLLIGGMLWLAFYCIRFAWQIDEHESKRFDNERNKGDNMRNWIIFLFAVSLLMIGCKTTDPQPCPPLPELPKVEGSVIVNDVLDALTTAYLNGSADGEFTVLEAVEGNLDAGKVIMRESGVWDLPVGQGAFCHLKVKFIFSTVKTVTIGTLTATGAGAHVLYNQDSPGAPFADQVTTAVSQTLQLVIADGSMTWGELKTVISAGIVATVKAAGKCQNLRILGGVVTNLLTLQEHLDIYT